MEEEEDPTKNRGWEKGDSSRGGFNSKEGTGWGRIKGANIM